MTLPEDTTMIVAHLVIMAEEDTTTTIEKRDLDNTTITEVTEVAIEVPSEETEAEIDLPSAVVKEDTMMKAATDKIPSKSRKSRPKELPPSKLLVTTTEASRTSISTPKTTQEVEFTFLVT
jgi:hypothetical protein